MNIRKICAWCSKELGSVPGTGTDKENTISHGICPDCLREFLGQDSLSLVDFLNQFHFPVLVVDSERKTLWVNEKATSLLKKQVDDVTGNKLGAIFECQNAKNGCGQSIHCRSCVIRKTIKTTFETGISQIRVPAYPDLSYMTGENKVRFLISTEKREKTVFLKIEDISLEPLLSHPSC